MAVARRNWRHRSPQRGFGLSFFFSFALALHPEAAWHTGNASLVGIECMRRLARRRTCGRPSFQRIMSQRRQNHLSWALTGADRKWPDKSPRIYQWRILEFGCILAAK